VILQILAEPTAKALEARGRCQEVIFVILKELFDLLFERSFEKSLDPAFGVVSLPRQLSRLLVLLPIGLLDHVGDLVEKSHLFVVIQVGAYIFSDSDQGHGQLG